MENSSALARAGASAVYLLPFFDALVFGKYLAVELHLEPAFRIALGIYGLLPLQPFTSIIVFFVLLFAVAWNQNVSRFIRFNTLQAILIDFILIACGLILDVFGQLVSFPLAIATLYNTVFLCALVGLGYAIVQSVRGLYAEIPTLSDAVNSQIR